MGGGSFFRRLSSFFFFWRFFMNHDLQDCNAATIHDVFWGGGMHALWLWEHIQRFVLDNVNSSKHASFVSWQSSSRPITRVRNSVRSSSKPQSAVKPPSPVHLQFQKTASRMKEEEEEEKKVQNRLLRSGDTRQRGLPLRVMISAWIYRVRGV